MIGFVILHYMAYDETIKCTEKILENVREEKKIVIVDNASSNGSGQKLKEYFANNDDVIVILQSSNLGFAKGNNIGFQYIKSNFNCDYLVILNNDVEISDQCFKEKLDDAYQKYDFDVLGPDIYCTTLDVHQSPKRLSSYTYNEVVSELDKYRKKSQSKYVTAFKCYLKKIPFLKKMVHGKRRGRQQIDYNKTYFNVPLHGSCVVYSKKFIEKRSYAFFDQTFMYFELEILDYECHRDSMKTVYYPAIKVLHHHNVSTNLAYKSELQKVHFMNQCICESLEKFVELMEKDRN